MAPALEHYLVQLVLATRDPSPYLEGLADKVEWGASPRGTIALDRCSRARAWLCDRDYVTPEDVLSRGARRPPASGPALLSSKS